MKEYPSYLKLLDEGRLKERIDKIFSLIEECKLCPRVCGVNRLKGEKGVCRTGKMAIVSSFGPHFGEESPISGFNGSGTIFFTNCNLKCIFCQNYSISHLGEGEEVTPEELKDMMLSLQRKECHNLNLVSPTHQVPQILEALYLALKEGFSLPIVYNSGGYDSVETLRILDGIVDIYMPDAKYGDLKIGEELSSIPDYFEVNKLALAEMHKQVGDLELDKNGVAIRGLLVRHLVLPNGLSGTSEVMRFIANEISPSTYVNLMDQYYPCFKGVTHPLLGRRITFKEYLGALEIMKKEGVSLRGVEERYLYLFDSLEDIK